MAADPQNLIFGRYELIRRLALGGMGEVFLARQTGGVTGAERLVILKSLLPELAEQDGFVDQFLDEARVAAKLNHPNVVQMFEAGLWNGVYFIAMEYIRGENLSRIHKAARAKRTPLPIHIVVRIVRDALNGLGHAHAAIDDQTGRPLGVVHRDVSPQNIMVRVDGVTKVVDFGIAKSGNRSSRTATGVLKGKLQYMSPEQVRGDELDHRSDQFAMGVVVWELLTGQRLFIGDHEIQLLKAVLEQPIAAPSSLMAGFPAELEAVIMRMLERDPEARYPSCAEAADALSAWLGQGSRRVSEADVAGFIKPIVGDNVDEMSRNSSPSGENFMLQLGHTPSRGSPSSLASPSSSASSATEAPPGTSATGQHRLEQTRARKVGVGVGLGAAAIVVVVAVGLFIAIADPGGRTLGTSSAQTTPTTSLSAAPATSATSLSAPGPATTPTPLAPPVVDVATEPSGASIIVGASSFGMTPARLTRLSAGASHELTLQKDGYLPQKVLVADLKDGDERQLWISLEKIADPTNTTKPTKTSTTAKTKTTAKTTAPPVDATPGTLAVNTRPGSSKVFLDGVLVGTTPFFLARVAPGSHTVVLENLASGVKMTRAIVVAPGEKTKLDEKWK